MSTGSSSAAGGAGILQQVLGDDDEAVDDEPLETVVKQVLSVLVLAAITRVAYVNWDTIYLAYQVVMGDKPLVKL